jgi:hypothetical protein
MIFEIAEIDRDYNAYTGSTFIKAKSKEQADEWCRENTWTGHDYFVIGEVTYRSTADHDLTEKEFA